jgi:ankyrin repeat protein
MASTADLVRDVKDSNLLAVRKAVEAGSPLSLSEYSAAGLTPLGAAVLYRKADIAQILLDAGADIQLGYKSELCQDKDARQSDWPEVSPPTHCAAALGQSDLIRVLVSYAPM